MRIVHLGVGNFHRAHQAWYTAHAPDADRWGIAGFTGRRPDMADALTPQDGLYTLITRHAAGDAYELIGSLAAVHPATGHEAFLAYLADPATAIITITVTEAGYLRNVQGRLDLDHPGVVADLAALRADPRSPVTSLPGKLVAGLLARRAAETGPITILSCDNLPENGEVTRVVVTDLASRVDPTLPTWIEEQVDFATSMVDRITPATTDQDRTLVVEATGRWDAEPVPTEPFSEWVVSGRFPAGRPRWEDAGAQLVDDVGPFEQRKLRLLNGSHSLLAYAGSIRGHDTIDEAIADPICRAWVEQYWDEAGRHLDLPEDEIAAYRSALLERFSNPRVRHRLAQIAADGSTKLVIRILPTIRAERAVGRIPAGCATAIAAWVLHLRGRGAPVNDTSGRCGADSGLQRRTRCRRTRGAGSAGRGSRFRRCARCRCGHRCRARRHDRRLTHRAHPRPAELTKPTTTPHPRRVTMTRPDLTAQPFGLDDDSIAWVRATIEEMSLEEKVGQLFINLNNRFDDAFVNRIIDGYHPGGIRYNHTDSASVQAHIRQAQTRSKVPLLVASNIEAGGNGACTDGTLIATPLQTASTPDTDAARQMGVVGGRESAALGCNWAFTPIVDIHHNWRNTVVATRAFGNDHETVIRYAQAYSDGVREGAGDRPMALCMKHFPGDGRDERDQHVVTSYNDCTVSEWDATYRKIWEWGIGAGIESVMVGHIMLPAYTRQLRPGIPDADILPATVAPELLTDLLRDDLGFNGVVLTDASLMVGLTSALPRERQMVQAITAGCDMILFFRNHDEDFGFVRDAVSSGEITHQRLDDALTRILGLKAKLGLHLRAAGDLVPPPHALAVIGAPEHHTTAREIADRTITLLKDTAGTLPLDPSTASPVAVVLSGERPRLHRDRAGVQTGGGRGADRCRFRRQRVPDSAGTGRRR